MSDGKPQSPLGSQWRAETARRQELALPTGRVLVSCSAPLGTGGLGRHLAEILAALERRGQPAACICASAAGTGTSSRCQEVSPRGFTTMLGVLPMRFSSATRTWAASVDFDACAARRLPAGEHLIAFNGTAVAQFRAASRARYQSLSLVAANSHFRRLTRQHTMAYRAYPLEASWSTRLTRRNLLEYSQADRIYVASRYAWQSFIEEGFSEDVLSLFPLTPDPRFQPDRSPQASATFDIVYIGSLTVAKGVPLLIDAFRRLSHEDMRLVLVGGWRSRGMRRFVQRACAADSRISVSPGDPLPHLRKARLCVHPSYEDGFAYAPAEALACGVPVLVNEDTGMKELVDTGRNGEILPTGDLPALTEAIAAAYRGEIAGG